MTRDLLQSAQENIWSSLQHEMSDHFVILLKEKLVCIGISGSLGSEKWILRWAGYVARMDITYTELYDYTGHQVLGRLKNWGDYDGLGI